MFGEHLEVRAAGAGDRVPVAIAAAAAHGESAGRNQFIEREALAMECHVAAFGLADLQEVTADAGQADSLGGHGAGVGGRQSLQIVVVDAEKDGGNNHDRNDTFHKAIVSPECSGNKDFGSYGAFRNNPASWRFRSARFRYSEYGAVAEAPSDV